MTRLFVIAFIAVSIAILVVMGPLWLACGYVGVCFGAALSSILDG